MSMMRDDSDDPDFDPFYSPEFDPLEHLRERAHIFNPAMKAEKEAELEALRVKLSRARTAWVYVPPQAFGLVMAVGVFGGVQLIEHLKRVEGLESATPLLVAYALVVALLVAVHVRSVLMSWLFRRMRSRAEKQAAIWGDESWVLPGEWLAGFYVKPGTSDDALWEAASLLRTAAPVRELMERECGVANPSPGHEEDHAALHQEIEAVVLKVGRLLNPDWVPEDS